jgi:hypothetical protein
MPDQNKTFSNQFATVYTSTTAAGGVGFGFNASRVMLTNDGAGMMLFTLASTGPATTGDYQLSSGETRDMAVLTAGVGFKSTATSTAGPSIRVGAWG